MRPFSQQLTDARDVIREGGVAALAPRTLLYFSRVFFRRQAWHIWSSEVGGRAGGKAGETLGARFEVVNGPEDLDRLVSGGLSIGPPFSVDDAHRMLAEGKVGLMTFVQGGLASWIWAATDQGGRIHPPLKKVDYTKEAYLGDALTSPRCRGAGMILSQYDRQAEFLRSRGRSVAISATLTGNDAGLRVEEKLGSVRCGQMKMVRVLMYEFWAEKWFDGR